MVRVFKGIITKRLNLTSLLISQEINEFIFKVQYKSEINKISKLKIYHSYYIKL